MDDRKPYTMFDPSTYDDINININIYLYIMIFICCDSIMVYVSDGAIESAIRLRDCSTMCGKPLM